MTVDPNKKDVIQIKVSDYKERKVCDNCGKDHTHEVVQVIKNEMGLWWDCECNSTMFINIKKKK